MYYTEMRTPIGPLLLAADEAGLRHILFHRDAASAPPEWHESKSRLAPVVKQLDEYFKGQRTQFELKLAPEGTPFQTTVWYALAEIPYGETISYGELAARIDRPRAIRAVGAANGANPLPIVLPCHRVIGKNGKLVGFGGGLPTKAALLDSERSTANGQGSLF